MAQVSAQTPTQGLQVPGSATEETGRLNGAHSRRGTGKDTQLRRLDPHTAVVILIDSAAALCAVRSAGGSAAGAVAFLGAVIGVDLIERHRTRRLSPSALDDAPALAARGIIIAAVTTAVGLPVSGEGIPGGAGPLVTATAYVVIAVVGRAVGYRVLRLNQARGRFSRSAVVVGTGPVGTKIARHMADHPEHGLRPVGFVEVAPPARPERLPAPMLGAVTDLPRLVVENRVDDIVVSFCQMRDAELVDVLRACDRLDCEVHVVPRLFELGVDHSAAVEHVWGLQLLRLGRAPFRNGTWTVKRLFDIAFAATVLALVSPFILALALLLRWELGPGVLFRQVRIGLDGRRFLLVKFRTLKPQPDDTPATWSVVGEDRMGPIGAFLRRSSLDELPQLWNVMRGHMSLVGPRPEQPTYVAQFARRHHRYHARLRVPAGVTGWAQIHDLRGDTSIEDRVRFDNYYIEHWSLWQDIKIIARTLASVLGMRGG